MSRFPVVSDGSPPWSPGDGLYVTCEPNESFPSQWVWFFVFVFCFVLDFGQFGHSNRKQTTN